MKLYLIRHAESYGNIKGKIISTTDFELTEKGIAQSQRIGQKICSELKGVPMSAYCSSIARAKQTLLEILRCIGQENPKITETDSLKEMDLGLLEGMTWEERRQKYPEVDLDKKLSLLQAPCGESYQDVKNRCKIFVEKYLEQEADEKSIIIVSHGITLRILTNTLLKRPDEDINFLNWMENTALTELSWEKESHTYQLVRLNDYSHLGELQTIGYEKWGLFATHDYWIK
ncbi:MAG: histidine phosphatase family protein [Lachnospiraceae bacterium]|nr:histidine phosphatase family protein [Lachnospiraceae bacterium]